ncbi:amino-acid N-acetyltransferase [Acinetobacter rathckeae]|uniref:amino-acid N-acetyltransferase n=1 Tax=Acinetobacter rathckeae TaxID=2605272 RepID=UPI0018A27583|nr:amino-acid N-acetyltransferase [Acinetobacter rathckeae]MBF7688832.1 amino-acid N-acetyltransferase [Acinetobacter rathckeae]MBF7696309.1 amino-acid N-acetyltransferase [Acinetobacter rathckeae]
MSTNQQEIQTLRTQDYLHWFRHSAPYINAHRNKTFVILFEGAALKQEGFHHIIHDIALLHSLGIRLVLVHGAREQIDDAIAKQGIETRTYLNRRVTTREALAEVMSAVGASRLYIEALLSMGLANSPMFGAKIDVVSGNFITAKPFGIHDGIDFHLSGEVRTVDTACIHSLLEKNNIILLGPMGYSTTGEVFNLLSQEVATKTAIALNADKLIFLCSQDGLRHKQGHLLREISPHVLDDYIEHKSEVDPQLSLLLKSAKEAALNGVQRVHLLPFSYDGALIQELFTRDGMGTMITDAHYEQVRTATIHDVGGLMELLKPLEEQGILVYRSRERLEHEIDQFAVIERDGTILACAALYPMDIQKNEIKSAEIACVAVHPSYRKSNRGQQILAFLEQKAQHLGIEYIFVLTTRTAHWFLEQGFVQASVDDLPSSRQQLYNYQRNSQVFKKTVPAIA